MSKFHDWLNRLDSIRLDQAATEYKVFNGVVTSNGFENKILVANGKIILGSDCCGDFGISINNGPTVCDGCNAPFTVFGETLHSNLLAHYLADDAYELILLEAEMVEWSNAAQDRIVQELNTQLQGYEGEWLVTSVTHVTFDNVKSAKKRNSSNISVNDLTAVSPNGVTLPYERTHVSSTFRFNCCGIDISSGVCAACGTALPADFATYVRNTVQTFPEYIWQNFDARGEPS